MSKELVQMAIDTYKGSTGEFSQAQSNEAIRKALIELNGGEEKITDKSFRRNPALFEFLEETLRVLVVEGLTDQFSEFAEVRDVAMGDQQIFRIPDTKLFRVATISDGNQNIRLQRIDNGEVPIKTVWRGVGIYEELSRVMAGRIDWVEMINRVSRSYQKQIANEVYSAVYNSYDKVNAPYKATASFDPETVIEIAQHVEAATDSQVMILGTKQALAKVKPSQLSDRMKDRKNDVGYLGVFEGYELHEIKQAHKIGTDEFAVDPNFLLIVPVLEDKMVKIVNEGEARIKEVDGLENEDMSQEYKFFMKSGITVVSAQKYGIVRFA
ncbi:hypothetical protein PQ478_08495 [Alkalihalophilus pseudofirmus]|uniref:hypothetical protein n=1 Tax=Alkalihalophilus pseudofirmus TaxID=79885 RepID=UPI00259B9090|nr:hypothetical protein [Alkalihalophilus pseudofirmus]WEG18507.1 hypothetical protein PQ478_08495 [Alkalihalophilus pseudofirmus]